MTGSARGALHSNRPAPAGATSIGWSGADVGCYSSRGFRTRLPSLHFSYAGEAAVVPDNPMKSARLQVVPALFQGVNSGTTGCTPPTKNRFLVEWDDGCPAEDGDGTPPRLARRGAPDLAGASRSDPGERPWGGSAGTLPVGAARSQKCGITFLAGLHPVLQAPVATLFTWSKTALGAVVVFVTRELSCTFLDAALAAGVRGATRFGSLGGQRPNPPGPVHRNPPECGKYGCPGPVLMMVSSP